MEGGESNAGTGSVGEHSTNGETPHSLGIVSRVGGMLWKGGTVYDAWLNATSTQIAQVLLTLPTSFAQLGMVSGIVFQVFYGLIGCWTCYLITCLYADHRVQKEKLQTDDADKHHIIQWYEVLNGILGKRWRVVGVIFTVGILFCTATIQLIACGSTVYYINDSLDKRTWTFIFGACCLLTVLLPSAENYRVFSFLGIMMTSFTAWYLTISAGTHGQKGVVKHTGAHQLVPYFSGATNILYAFGGHAVTVEIMHAMKEPRKFKIVYFVAILYIFTLTLPSAITVYWAFGDKLLSNSNAFAVLPRTKWRDAAVIFMLCHQFFEFGLVSLPIFLVWEKALGIHHKRFALRATARIPVVLALWFLALMFPFFGPINSAVGSLLVTFGVYVIPCLAYMKAYSNSTARKNAVEQPPFFIPSWTAIYVLNTFIVGWVIVAGFGLGGYASVRNIVKQVHTFGFFAKCYQCPKKS